MRRPVLAATLVAGLLVAGLGTEVAARAVVEHRIAARLSDRLDEHGAGVGVTAALGSWPVLPRLVTGSTGPVALTLTLPFPLLEERLAEGDGALAGARLTADGGLLVVEPPGRDGLGLLVDVDVAGTSLVLTPTAVRVAGLQVPVAALGERRAGRLGAALDPREVPLDALAGLGPADGARLSAAVTPTGLVVTADVGDLSLDGARSSTP